MTAIPCLIIVGLAYPATKTMIAMKDTSHADITVKATGYQWKWRYDYLGEDIGFYSDLSTPREQIENRARKGENYLLEVDHPLVVPVGKKVRILVTANDVITRGGCRHSVSSRTGYPVSCATRGSRSIPLRVPWPVRRTVWQGARLHAHRRGGGT